MKIKKTASSVLRKIKLKEDFIKPPGIETNTPIVFHAFLEKIQIISEMSNEKGIELPDNLVIPKGKYIFSGKTYNLDKEGVYRFVNPGKNNKQRIVFETNHDALLSSIAWIYSHGNKDDEKEYSEILTKAKNEKIFATCGTISNWSIQFLKNNGIKARIVAVLTLEDWNSYDNGHILIEVFQEKLKKWVLYDIDNDAYFTHNGNPLSLLEFTKKVKENNYEINFIAKKNDIDISNFVDKENNYNYSFLIEARFLDEETRRKWYNRVFQVPMIVDEKYSYFFDENNKSKILSYSSFYQYLEKHTFMKKFYNFDNS
ncbi:hypothetical protein OAJ50_01270 [Candidatus Nitrosopelagicus sp.]|nr:hypothetical protein [Candidatus Nitrosopelagicus sp.]